MEQLWKYYLCPHNLVAIWHKSKENVFISFFKVYSFTKGILFLLGPAQPPKPWNRSHCRLHFLFHIDFILYSLFNYINDHNYAPWQRYDITERNRMWSNAGTVNTWIGSSQGVWQMSLITALPSNMYSICSIPVALLWPSGEPQHIIWEWQGRGGGRMRMERRDAEAAQESRHPIIIWWFSTCCISGPTYLLS